MKVSEFKAICDGLGRFATTREKAGGPEAYIGVQKRGDTLKFISGNRRAAFVVNVQEFWAAEGDYSYTVLARPFLQAAKVLPSKAQIKILTDDEGVHIQAEGGGVFDVSLTDTSIKDVGFAKKPKTFRCRGKLDVKTLKRMSKLFKAISAKVEVPSVQIIKGVGYATAIAPGDARAMYANYRFPAESANGPDDEYNMAAYREFWESLTHFQVDGTLEWGRDGVLLRAGDFECFSAPYLVSSWDNKTRIAGPPEEQRPWPIMVATEQSDVAFTIERKRLQDTVKGQAPFDEHNRVTLEVGTDSVRVMPFGSSDGMDLQCKASGRGFRSVNADYLLALLGAMDSKEVTLRWGRGQPAISISSEDYTAWTILLAPVAL